MLFFDKKKYKEKTTYTDFKQKHSPCSSWNFWKKKIKTYFFYYFTPIGNIFLAKWVCEPDPRECNSQAPTNVSSSEQRVQPLLPAEERLILRLPSQKQQVSDRGFKRLLKMKKKKERKHWIFCCHTVPLEAHTPFTAALPHCRPIRSRVSQACESESEPSCFSLCRYFGFITKHPADHRFACHVFVSENSTKPLAESVGWVPRSTLQPIPGLQRKKSLII